MAWKITTPATLEPVSLAEAKTHLKISTSTEDTLIQAYLDTAVQEAEEFCRQSFLTQTVEEIFPKFSDIMELHFSPLQSITSVEYYDEDNANQTLSSSVYYADDWQKPGRVILAVDQQWPTVTKRFDAIKVTYLSGWAAASSVPESIKTAIKLKLTMLYEKRIDEHITKTQFPSLRKASNDLLRPYRILTL